MIALGDLNGDGELDVIGRSSSQVRISTGFGDGSFADAVAIPVPNLDAQGGVLAGDLDGDGLVDLILSDENALAILLNNGDGTFQVPIRLSAPGLSRQAAGAAPSIQVLLADLSQDGLLDILAADTVLLRKP